MNRQKNLLILLLVSLALLILHYIALKFYLYWTVTWFDVITHFIGGFFLGMVGLMLFVEFSKEKNSLSEQFQPKILPSLAFTFLLALSIGALWEVWELYNHLTSIDTDALDTLGDLVCDSVGAVAGYFALLKISWKKN